MTRRVGAVLIVDPRGRLLLQLRDANAPNAPHRWALPGGHVEPGEAPERGALREVREETGLTLDEPLDLFWHGERVFDPTTGFTTLWWVYWSATEAAQEDVVLGEGAQMKFVDAADIGGLPMALNAAYFVDLFLRSPQYAGALRRGQ